MGSAATKPRYSKSNLLDTSSKSINETVNGSHEFVIRGYSLAKGMGIGKLIKSFAFTVGGYEWIICFYPDGQTAAYKEFVSVFVVLLSPGTDVRALFELKLLDQSGKGKHKVDSHFDSPLETGPFTLKSKGSIWGFPQYLKRSVLESSNYLKDDCLVIHCTVGVVGTRVEGRKHYAIPVPPSDMIPSLKSLLESGTGSDITFQVGDKTFKAHKLVVATRSPVFRAQFFGLVGNPGMNTAVIEDFDPIAFKAMLLFLYSDELPEAHELFDSDPRCTSTVVVQHLLAAADRFDLARLKLICEAKLCEEIAANTVAITLALAEQHHCVQLKTVCLNFAARPENLGAVMQSEGFAYLEDSCPSLLLELLETVAEVDKESSHIFNRKRNGHNSSSNANTGLRGLVSSCSEFVVKYFLLCCENDRL
ncbi:BTB/POZ and MATH domain-containing protein 3-like [Papaver somniferum]|uniref:BTB/POZ and MATH domain-containing protein 3-like n=1 Tax=Papaver somniferum TaxID=3469 RepID=UPI000E6F780D|nr:BTB/POZ and MATH domain-containing protein 3-like [Papaver somniferum]